MTTKNEIQALLRFLTQDAKVPLPAALSKVKDLQKFQLISPETLANTSLTKIQSIFPDEKQAKAVLAAAKRVTKKRSSGEPTTASPAKRSKPSTLIGSETTPESLETSLTLPITTIGEEDLASTTLITNRAPLVLAFSVTLIKYTMPSQPLSSCLSLAQAVVSANSRSKAVSIGLADKGTSAEDQGWGVGQPGVRVMGREVKVMKRQGYDWKEPIGKRTGDAVGDETQLEPAGSQLTLKQEEDGGHEKTALWGLDLEALRSSNGPLVAGAQSMRSTGLPVHSAHNARAYLSKSFASPRAETSSVNPNKKSSAAAQKAEREDNLAKLLRALDMLYESWAHVLSIEELDRRAWSWYVAVRPDVKDGVAGWGGRGEVKLGKVLEMRRNG